jgi:hypothetical protein
MGNEGGRQFLGVVRGGFKLVYLGILIAVDPDYESPTLFGSRKRRDLLPRLYTQASLIGLRLSGQG